MIVRLIAPAMIKYAITPTMINESAIKKLNQEGFHLVKDNDLFSVVINSENYTFRIYDNGILVFNYQMELPDVIPYQEVLTKKEEKTREIIDREGSVVQFLKTIELVIESIIPNIKESLFFNGKYVSYCLATYRVSPENKVTAYSLALKRPVKEDQIQSLNEQSLKVVTVKDNTQLLLIWGARVLIGDDELSLNLYDDYVKNEFLKLELYKRISRLEDREDLDAVYEEAKDRFGEPPKVFNRLLEVSYIKTLAHKSYIEDIKYKDGEVYYLMNPSAKIKVDLINKFIRRYKGRMRLVNEKQSGFAVKTSKLIQEEMIDGIKSVIADIDTLIER